MCGIVGKVNRRDDVPVDRDVVERMCIALEHRGPDSRGLFVDGEVGLGIQRLRVVDLVTGDQPIHNEDGSIVVVLNGEIYNFGELREQLSRRGHRLSTQGDTEVIVHLYEEYGVDCVRHLHGMFAFALWDAQRRQLLLARDRIGKKPLFYAFRDGSLTFASELRALIEDPTVPRDVDPAAIDRYLTYGYVPTPHCVFGAARKLPPAHTLVLSDGHIRVERYWRLDYSNKVTVKDPRELHGPIRDAIRAATRRRLVADVPLGAFLSGGIDSSAVVAAMAEASTGPVKTFSIGFESEQFNELPHARRVAEQFATEHHEFVVRPDAIGIVPRIVRQYGEPFADASAIPSFYLAEVTRRHVTVALNGDGGDESFGGYTRYVANRLASRLDVLPLPLRQAAAAAGRRLPGGEVTSWSSKARRLTTGLVLPPADRYGRYVSWFDQDQRAALYTDEFATVARRSNAPQTIAGPWQNASGDDVLDVMLEVDATTYLPDDLITKIDIATMAHALEARSPLLDHELMEFAASLPADLKVRGGQKKWILREALRGWLPHEVLDRPKQGFSVPVGEWFRGELRDQVHEVLLDPGSLSRGYFRAEAVRSLLHRHGTGAADESKRLWSLYMLELWHREFVDPVPAPVELVSVA
jgi:asparagine synthase (glutamine-hydrolysing)